MTDRRERLTGRSAKVHSGPVNVLPKTLTDSDELRALPPAACKLLLTLLPRYNGPGMNNGGLLILVNQPKRYGFSCIETLMKARDDLLSAGFLVRTRVGTRSRAATYGLTWMGIDVPGDECKVSPRPLHLWKQENAEFREAPTRQSNRRNGTLEDRSPYSENWSKDAPETGTHPPACAPISGASEGKTPRLGTPETGVGSCITMSTATNQFTNDARVAAVPIAPATSEQRNGEPAIAVPIVAPHGRRTVGERIDAKARYLQCAAGSRRAAMHKVSKAGS